MPGLEVHGFGRADAEQDPQDHWIGDPLGQGWIEAGAALLDKAEVECRRVGDGLDVLTRRTTRRTIFGLGPGDCRKRPGGQARDRLRKIGLGVSKIWVKVAAAIPRPPTGIDSELREIGEPFPNFFGLTPVAVLPFKVRNLSRLTSSSPFETR